jgi:hypothetical protein
MVFGANRTAAPNFELPRAADALLDPDGSSVWCN